jgi:hypothetical protein
VIHGSSNASVGGGLSAVAGGCSGGAGVSGRGGFKRPALVLKRGRDADNAAGKTGAGAAAAAAADGPARKRQLVGPQAAGCGSSLPAGSLPLVEAAGDAATSLAVLQQQLSQPQQLPILPPPPHGDVAAAGMGSAAAGAWLRGLATPELAELLAAAGAEMVRRLRG